MKLLREIPCWDTPRKIKFSPDGKQIFVNVPHGRYPAHMIDPQLSYTVFDLDYLDDRRTVVVRLLRRNRDELEYQLVIADTHTQKNIKSVTLPGQSLGMCADHRQKRIYVGIYNSVYVYDYNLNHVTTLHTRADAFFPGG